MKNENKKTESDFFIKKRSLGQLFDSEIPLNFDLYRGQPPDSRGDPILYPLLKSFIRSDGKERRVDIETYPYNGEQWVKSLTGGVSLFDVLGVPVKTWDYYKIEAGTLLPNGLVITKDEKRMSRKPKPGEPVATHHTIRPNWDMPLRSFLFLLDDLVSKFNRVK